MTCSETLGHWDAWTCEGNEQPRNGIEGLVAARAERSIDSREKQRLSEVLMREGSDGSEQQRHSEVCLAMELHGSE